MRTSFIVPVVVAMALSLSACDSAKERAEKHFQSAVELLKAGDLARAKVEFRNVFQLDPDSQKARMTLASALQKAGDFSGAYQQYIQVADQHPDNAEATLQLAEIALDNQQWSDAERYGRRLTTMDVDPKRRDAVIAELDYRKAVMDNDPAARKAQAEKLEQLQAAGVKSEIMLLMLTDWYDTQNEPRKAVEQTRELIKLAPEKQHYYLVLVDLLHKLGQDDEVADTLRSAIDKFPDNKDMLSTLIQLYISRGQLDDAEAFLRERATAPDLDKDKREAMEVGLIQFLEKYRDRDAALAETEKALATTDNPDLFHSIHGGLLFSAGQRDKGLAEVQEVVKTAEPSDQTRRIMLNLAKMLTLEGNKVGARAEVEQILAQDPEMVGALKMKAGFLIDGDDADQAIVVLRHAQQQSPNDAELATLLARAYERNGDRDLMGEALALAVQYSDSAPAETIAQARFLMSDKRYLPAEQTLIQALRKQPKNLDLLKLLGQDYLLAQRYSEADGVVTRLQNIGGKDATDAAQALHLQSLKAQNRVSEIAQIFDNLSDSTDDKTRAALLSAQASLARHDLDSAQKTLDAALEASPQDAYLLYAKGVLENQQGNIDQARATLRQVLALKPGASKAWVALTNTYTETNDLAGALKVLDEAVVAQPGDLSLQIGRSALLEKTGDIAGAIGVYDKIYDERSSSVVMANNYASLLATYNDDPQTLEKAYKIAKRLRGLPQPAFQDTYGWIAFRRGDTTEALHSLEPAAQRLTSDPLVQYHLGRVYEALGRFADAEAQYRKSEDILGDTVNPGAPDLAERLASVTAEAAKQKQE